MLRTYQSHFYIKIALIRAVLNNRKDRFLTVEIGLISSQNCEEINKISTIILLSFISKYERSDENFNKLIWTCTKIKGIKNYYKYYQRNQLYNHSCSNRLVRGLIN